jgi:hypothetical protein
MHINEATIKALPNMIFALRSRKLMDLVREDLTDPHSCNSIRKSSTVLFGQF